MQKFHKSQVLLCCCLVYIAIIFILNYFNLLPKISENNYYNKTLDFQARIIKEPEENDQAQKITVKSDKFKKYVLISTTLFPKYHYGDVLDVNCKITEPEVIEDFNYPEYLARYNIYSLCYQPEIKLLKTNQGNFILSAIYKTKNIFLQQIYQIWRPPISSFIAGLVIGQKGALPKKITDLFQTTGTIHILVVSGYQVMLLANFLYLILNNFKVKRQQKIYYIFFALIFFAILTGLEASVLRASLMALIVFLAEKFGRPKRYTNILILSCALILIINPRILSDVGFQLSFLATAGLLYLSEPLNKKILFFLPNIFEFRNLLSSTCAAIIATTPIIIYNFHRVSLIAPIANIIIVPLTPFITLASLFIILISFIYLPLAQFLGFSVMFLVEIVLKLTAYLAHFSWASINI